MNKNLLIILFGLLISFNASAAFVPGDVALSSTDPEATSSSWDDISNGWQLTSQYTHYNTRNSFFNATDIYSFQVREGYMYDISFGIQGMGGYVAPNLHVITRQYGVYNRVVVDSNRVTSLGLLASDILQGGDTTTNVSFRMGFLLHSGARIGSTFSVNEYSAVPLPGALGLFLPALGFLARRRIRTN